jgi:N-acetylglucosamine kinase-like BadF-type ATPase
MVIEHAFEKVFTNADFYIEHDLLGAARSSCGNSEGIACILGTGSNSCFYDGKLVTDHIFSLGYFFGDEGSGAYMGKQLLTSYLHNELPEDLMKTFQAGHNLSNENILDAVYNKPAPSRFLASFSTFISDNRNHPFINELIRNNFRNFYKYQVACYPRHKEVPVNFVGSVAYHYQDILHEIGEEFGITIGKVIQAPIDGLVDFHRQ